MSEAADPTTAGLYHSAILYEDEAGLAAALVNVAQAAPMTFQGSADHRVSLAFCLADHDGGIAVDDPWGNTVNLFVG